MREDEGGTGDGQEHLNALVSLGTRREEAALSEHPHLRGPQETTIFFFLLFFCFLQGFLQWKQVMFGYLNVRNTFRINSQCLSV